MLAPASQAKNGLFVQSPLNPSLKYAIALAAAAQKHQLHPGSFFGLPAQLRKGLQKAIDEMNFDPQIKIGFDPTHIEATGLTITEAKAGKRPA